MDTNSKVRVLEKIIVPLVKTFLGLHVKSQGSLSCSQGLPSVFYHDPNYSNTQSQHNFYDSF
jgi:hypothetical protein